MSFRFSPGDTVPWFHAPTLRGNDNFAFSTAAGRHVMLLCVGSAGSPEAQAALQLLDRRRALFDDRRACFFGVTTDPGDAASGRIARMLPGIRWFLDYEGGLSKRLGAVEPGGSPRPQWLLLDPALRVLERAELPDGDGLFERLADCLAAPVEPAFAPVLVVPRVFDRALCRRLIALYDRHGGKASGFMNEQGGKTVGVVDSSFKRRSDHYLDDEPELRAEIVDRLRRTILPQMRRAFQFHATRIERYLIACYDGDGDGGFFRAHRDNTTTGTAHRRFACTINLNAEDYDGGELRFPEYGDTLYRAPTGGAVIFSCSLLHEAMPVTRGRRYAYLPFLYDDAAARQREANAQSGRVNEGLAAYRA